MFVELIELLRCPNEHEEAQLIASARRTEARHIRDGLLGCPVCGAEFPIADGITTFDGAQEPPSGAASAEIAMRIAAFLELTDARGFAVLCGSWGAHAGEVRRLSETPLVLVNPPRSSERVAVAAVLRVDGRLPFAEGALRAIALDQGQSPATITSAVVALRAGGRVLAPTTVSRPSGITELVRDVREWVGEKTAASDGTPRLVALKRAGG